MTLHPSLIKRLHDWDRRKVAVPEYGYSDQARGDIVRIQTSALDDGIRNLILYAFGASKVEQSDGMVLRCSPCSTKVPIS